LIWARLRDVELGGQELFSLFSCCLIWGRGS
jgi:hypothetical protein